jgi:2,3-dihydroxybenzoate-AMP ligase
MSARDWGGRVVPFPDQVMRRYRSAGLWGLRTIAQEFRAIADLHPDRPAIVAHDGRMTYRELDERTDQLGAGLAALGLAPGGSVLFQVTNRLDTAVCWYGVLKAGLIPVCTLSAHRRHEIDPISRKVGAVAHLIEAGTRGFDLVAFATELADGHPSLRHVLVVGTEPGNSPTRIEDLGRGLEPATARKLVEEIQHGIDPDDVAAFQLSGGTTGIPKVIPRLHAEYWFNAAEYARSWAWDPTTRVGHAIPLIHNAGITCALHAAHSAGACLVLANPDLSRALPLFAAEGVTDLLLGHGHFGAVENPAFAALYPQLRRAVLSGAKVPVALFERLERNGVWAGQLFGMGEGLFLTTRPGAPREARLTTVGTPLSELDEITILQPGSEEPVPVGEVGELCCRGPYTLRGYFDAPEQNAQAFTADGFYRTGDLVAAHTIGGVRCLSVEGRIKELINRGGEKISAEEVEQVLLRHPRVVEAAVVAMPDERLGERTCAYVATRGRPLSLAEVRHHFAQAHVARFKWPERVELLAELPRTPVGKVDKKRLHADIAAMIIHERTETRS